ncbi:MAG: TIGR02147 family protein [Deltaproteobacteria bacterium]|nr:TIGR02147 family protein [Deltaproteobacteria bacterium]
MQVEDSVLESGPIDRLRAEFLARRSQNPQYSLRSFARDIGISSGALSQVFSRKRPLTKRSLERISRRLGIDSLAPSSDAYHLIQSDQFNCIADWYHYAILSLLETHGARSQVRWIASRLGISIVEAQGAIERLIRVGMVKLKGNSLVTTQKRRRTSTDVPNEALRKLHHQTLLRNAELLNEVPVEWRDVTMMTMAIDLKKLPLAKVFIKRFRRDLTRFLGAGTKTEVYNLCIQLVPVTRRESRRGEWRRNCQLQVG